MDTTTAQFLLQQSQLQALTQASTTGILDKRCNISSWATYHFSLSASRLWYFHTTPSAHRGRLVGSIPLHCCTVSSPDYHSRRFTIFDAERSQHTLRAPSQSQAFAWILAIRNASCDLSPSLTLPPKLKRKVDHVLCVVHGIGVDSELNESNIRELQDNYLEIMQRVFPDVSFHIELLPIHWRDAVRGLGIHRKLQKVIPITPGGRSVNPLRTAMCEKVVDYVYYTNERYRLHMLRAIARQLNEQVANFMSQRPDFNGSISILAHSLGAALIFDLMCRKVHDDQLLLGAEELRLSFEAESLFCIGNPLGIFHGLDPKLVLGADITRLPFRLFNIFKIHDPIATRLEPVVDPAYASVHPVMVPHWANMGVRESRLQWLLKLVSRWMNGAGEEGGGGDGMADGGVVYASREVQKEVVKRGRGWRVDFVLQQSNVMEDLSYTWSSICGHTEYWKNRDFMLMMVSCIFKSSLQKGWVGSRGSEECEREMDMKQSASWHQGGNGSSEKFLSPVESDGVCAVCCPYSKTDGVEGQGVKTRFLRTLDRAMQFVMEIFVSRFKCRSEKVVLGNC